MNTVDYTPMWKELGLDLQAHDQLLQILSQSYSELFLTQKNRPQGMKYFDFVISEAHGLRIRELLDARAQGRKVIGSFCVFVPEELILALDGIGVGLCAGAAFGFDLAEQMIPRKTCSLIKSAFGFKLSKICPYLEAADLIIGENTCDGKKKSFELFASIGHTPFLQLDLPQTRGKAGRQLLAGEYKRLMETLQELTGKEYSAEKLSDAIKVVNAKREALNRLNTLRQADPSPISGLDALLINQIAFYDDPVRFTASLNALCDELEENIRENSEKGAKPDRARVILSGCPMALPNWKVPALIQECGATLVGEELCTGRRGFQCLVTPSGSLNEMVDSILDRYLDIHCAVFTPNSERTLDVRQMTDSSGAGGVIHYSLQFCQPYQIEAPSLAAAIEKEGTPVLEIETDYSPEDSGQLKTRIQAFLERLEN